MEGAKSYAWRHALIWVLIFLKVEGYFVDITYVEDAVAKGAGK